uniref:C2H2-type domain-containing protein n=1 Tax=Ditylenchus dipsaci TaxID=166011 RepID=A0A915D9B6_9BILA
MDEEQVFEYSDEIGDYSVENFPEEEEEEEMDPNMVLEESFHEVEEEIGTHRKPRSVHQCNECNKIFVSFKGLQQHAIIHTDQKPFACDICSKAFRFKSNLFEHRSVHSGFTPHACPYCARHVGLEAFASNRRPPADIPQDAIIVRSTGEPSSLFTPPSRPRKRKLGLGTDSKIWVEKIKRGDILPCAPINEKMRRLADLIKSVEENGSPLEDLFMLARALPFERFDCLFANQCLCLGWSAPNT